MANIFQSKLFLLGGGAALILVVGGVFIASQYAGRSNSSEKMAALKAMRDSGAITDEQYQQDLRGNVGNGTGDPLADKIAALQELRDSGAISKDEYEQKVVALSTEGSPNAPGQRGGSPFTNGGTQQSSPFSSGDGTDQSGSSANSGGGFFSKLVSGGGSQKTVQVQDPVYGMPAAQLSMPQDWRFAGTVARGNDCSSTGPAVKFTATSGDGGTADEVFPGIAYAWTSNPQQMQQYRQMGCIVLQSTSPADFLRQIVLPHLRPNAQVGQIEPDPDLVQTVNQARGQLQNSLQQGASNYHQPTPQSWLDSARARVSYTRDGKPVEEYVSTIVQCVRFMMPSVMPGQGPWADQHCSAIALEILRAPQGQLDELPTKIKTVLHIEPNQQWAQRVSEQAQQEGQQQPGSRPTNRLARSAKTVSVREPRAAPCWDKPSRTSPAPARCPCRMLRTPRTRATPAPRPSSIT